MLIKINSKGFSKSMLLAGLLVAVIGYFGIDIYLHKASSTSYRLVSNGNCLDLYGNNTKQNNPIVFWSCDGTKAQSWTENLDTITHDNNYCLTVSDKKLVSKSSIVISKCENSANQIWLNMNGKLYNPDSEGCIESVDGIGTALVLSNCNDKKILTWSQEEVNGAKIERNLDCNKYPEGQKIACNAIVQWEKWNNGQMNHASLLNSYTDGFGYEEWCADFVSYIYKTSGLPFSGAYDKWDENVAANVQNYNFTLNDVGSNYVPKAGDVAFFEYNGSGHVEIVISGGSKPTFIYGDSAQKDPQTGIGDMKSNTISAVQGEGQLAYYLSPN